MTVQSYFIVEENVVTNCVMWDGNHESWTPPEGSIQLVVAETPAIIWVQVPVTVDGVFSNWEWELKECIGKGEIGFTWNGQVLSTTEEAPPLTQEAQ